MATVKIGGRELEVPEATMGFVRNVARAAHAVMVTELNEAEAVDGKSADEVRDAIHDALARYLLIFFDGQEGVDLAWLTDALPPLPFALVLRVQQLAGIGTKPGEAASP
jgi:hypothetical protein